MILRTHTERENPSSTPETNKQKLVARLQSWILRIVEGRELSDQITTLQSAFKEVWWERSRDRIKKEIKLGNLDAIIELEGKCPGMIKRLSKEYKRWDDIRLLPTNLDWSIKYAREDDTWTVNLYPIKKLIEKENPTKKDEDQAIAELNLIVDQNTFTIEEDIIKDWDFLLRMKRPENYKDYMQREYHMGWTHCDDRVRFLQEHLDRVIEQARKQWKPEDEIQILENTIKGWSQKR